VHRIGRIKPALNWNVTCARLVTLAVSRLDSGWRSFS
jgi:hypothetical protein